MTDTDARTLSSAQTALVKFVLPIFWVAVFGLMTLTMFLSPDTWRDDRGAPMDPSFRWFFFGGLIVGGAYLKWLCGPLKRVRMDDRSLYVSNYRDAIVIPLADVAEVTENRWWKHHPVTIHLHRETEFGTRIVFMPKVRWFAFWSSHPVVAEIRAAVDRATGRAAG